MEKAQPFEYLKGCAFDYSFANIMNRLAFKKTNCLQHQYKVVK
jgi:hypothetical protein